MILAPTNRRNWAGGGGGRGKLWQIQKEQMGARQGQAFGATAQWVAWTAVCQLAFCTRSWAKQCDDETGKEHSVIQEPWTTQVPVLTQPILSYFLAQKEVKLFRVSTSAVAYGEGPTNLLGWLSMFPRFLLSPQLRAVASSFCQQVSGVLTAAKGRQTRRELVSHKCSQVIWGLGKSSSPLFINTVGF